MTGWVMKTEFMTDKPLEHGNWSSVEFETEKEAWAWWDSKPTKSNTPRMMTMTAPDEIVWASRYVPVGGMG